MPTWLTERVPGYERHLSSPDRRDSRSERLAWRDHFTQKLEDAPDIERSALHPAFDSLRPATANAQALEAFTQGQTGYPMVDAVLRSLAATGWTTFRTGQCYDRHRNDEFLRFMKTVAKAYPRRQLHVIADNYATHNHPGVNAWLDKNPRIHTHFTPTSGSWRGLIEVFFGIIQRQAIKRGTFTSDKDVIAAITRFLDRWNQRCEPFTRTKTPDEILAKATRRGTAEARH